MRRSNSSVGDIGSVERLRYLFGLLSMNLRGLWREPEIGGVRWRVDEYRREFAGHTGKRLEDCRVLEIGFGQRPWVVWWLANLGIDIIGVDLDRPILSGGLGEFRAIARANGVGRAVKSFLRFHLFDRRERRALARAIEAETGRRFTMPVDRLRVSDAASEAFWRGLQPLDFIYSDDVFEHVPAEALERIVNAMAQKLKPEGLAFVRITVFTGITGSHLPEWYGYTLAEPRARRAEPWEHLRQDRFRADTYLNRLGRKAYRELMARYFDIVEERVCHPDLGRAFLTAALREELKDYDEEELFSNEVLFLLRPKSAAGPAMVDGRDGRAASGG